VVAHFGNSIDGSFTMQINPGNLNVYNIGDEEIDACIIDLDENIIRKRMTACTYRDCVAIACLPTSLPRDGDACWIAGWGSHGPKHRSSAIGINGRRLLQTGLNILPRDYCHDHAVRDVSRKITSAEFCAGHPDFDRDGLTDAGSGACQGDSGGPLICNIQGRAIIHGIVSRGRGCGQKGAPGLYVGVNQITPWIKSHMARCGKEGLQSITFRDYDNNANCEWTIHTNCNAIQFKDRIRILQGFQ